MCVQIPFYMQILLSPTGFKCDFGKTKSCSKIEIINSLQNENNIFLPKETVTKQIHGPCYINYIDI